MSTTEIGRSCSTMWGELWKADYYPRTAEHLALFLYFVSHFNSKNTISFQHWLREEKRGWGRRSAHEMCTAWLNTGFIKGKNQAPVSSLGWKPGVSVSVCITSGHLCSETQLYPTCAGNPDGSEHTCKSGFFPAGITDLVPCLSPSQPYQSAFLVTGSGPCLCSPFIQIY